MSKRKSKRILLTGETLFNLYCPDMGKPKPLQLWYLSNLLIDYSALEWLPHINEFKEVGIPTYMWFNQTRDKLYFYETDDDFDDFDIQGYFTRN